MEYNYAYPTDKFHGWACESTGGECMLLLPNSKLCAIIFHEGPDVTDTEEHLETTTEND